MVQKELLLLQKESVPVKAMQLVRNQLLSEEKMQRNYHLVEYLIPGILNWLQSNHKLRTVVTSSGIVRGV